LREHGLRREQEQGDQTNAVGHAATFIPPDGNKVTASRQVLIQAGSVLTGKQRHHLRGLAHALAPIVQVGKGGIDDGVVAAVDRALTDHELIKIKVGDGAGVDRHEAADEIAAQTRSEVAQVIGNVVVLYRPDPDEPKITLP
jgi:RNA-binding protein